MLRRRLLTSLLLVAAPLGAEPDHPFSVHDMLAMARISDPQVSPDGRRIVFAVRETDLEANRGRTDLWLVGTDGTGLRRLTTHPADDTNPRWAPSGESIYFLSERGDTTQVWRIPGDGGEARRVTDLPLDVTTLAVSPDGGKLALSVDVYPDCETLACTVERRQRNAAGGEGSGRLYERLFVRHWDTWTDGRRSHLLVVPANGEGPAVDVMRGMDADCPSKPFGGPEEYAFTPDGAGIVFTARDAGREEAWSTDFDLYRVPVDGSGAPRCLTEANEAWDTAPTFSPDGRRLAYLAMVRPGYESDRFRIVSMEWPSLERRVLTEEWDRSPRGVAWSSDGRTLYANADDLGQRALFAVDGSTGRATRIVAEGTVRSMAAAGDRVVYAADHLRSPVELYSIEPGVDGPRRLTGLNDARVAAARMGEPEQFTFEGWNGETVYAWVVKPAGFDPRRSYPVALLIHGGPQGSFGNEFHYRWNPQAYAGAGYAAVMVDFHGSTGYGQAFTDSIRGDWGGKPLEDLRRGLAAALARYPWMDGDRVAALGASYGGYMINWIAGNWPDRFRCLVNHDGDFDQRMAYYDTDELWFPEWEFGGAPWEAPRAYARHNPAEHVGAWSTPMLVIHGQRDFRVVVTQGLSTFTALQRRGVPSQLLYFPDENHWVLKPRNSIQWHDTVIRWIDRWTKPEGTP